MSYWWHTVPFWFFIQQNNYYGWNGKAESDAELIVDGITFLLFVLVGIGTISNKGNS